MPTHQGKTQTDIVIGDGGDSASLSSSIEFAATYGGTANFQYKRNNSASADNEDSSYELKALDASGATLGTFFAKYTCDPSTGTATDVDSTRTNTFNPAANGANPAAIPSTRATYALRTWSRMVFDGAATFASFQSRWEFASTVASGGSVSYAINTQTNDKLEITLTYTVGGSTAFTVVVTCLASLTATAGVTLGSVSVSDTIQ